jgi:hypothetical protein
VTGRLDTWAGGGRRPREPPLRCACLARRRPWTGRWRPPRGREGVASTCDPPRAWPGWRRLLPRPLQAPVRLHGAGPAAARRGGCTGGSVSRIVYLGGQERRRTSCQVPPQRQQTGDVLRASGVPVVGCALIVIGSGSLLRDGARSWAVAGDGSAVSQVRTSRSPSMTSSPVVAARPCRRGRGRVRSAVRRGFLSRHHAQYARQRRLRRWMIPVPPHAPPLEPLAGPGHAAIRARRPQADREPAQPHHRDRGPHPHDVLRPPAPPARGDRARPLPGRRGAGRHPLVGRPLVRGPPRPGGTRFGTRLVDSRATQVAVDPRRAFAPVRGSEATRAVLGKRAVGSSGALDLALGGVGLRRGRRDGAASRRRGRGLLAGQAHEEPSCFACPRRCACGRAGCSSKSPLWRRGLRDRQPPSSIRRAWPASPTGTCCFHPLPLIFNGLLGPSRRGPRSTSRQPGGQTEDGETFLTHPTPRGCEPSSSPASTPSLRMAPKP